MKWLLSFLHSSLWVHSHRDALFYVIVHLEALVVKNPPPTTGDTRDVGLIPGSGRSHGGENGNHSSIPVWKIPWTEQPVRPQSWVIKSWTQVNTQFQHTHPQNHCLKCSECDRLHYLSLQRLFFLVPSHMATQLKMTVLNLLCSQVRPCDSTGQ